MCPELFKIPSIHVVVKGFGLMIVIGFIISAWLSGRMSRSITPYPQRATNVALYALVGGLVYLFSVIHYLHLYIWQRHLELPGGAVALISILFLYRVYHRLPIRRYLDVLAVSLMLALVFGRIGCFLDGCCFGKPTSLPWGVRFPYNSFAYLTQINAYPARNRSQPQLNLPRADYLAYAGADNTWYPKHYEDLAENQKIEVTKGPYRCLPVHPTQLYSSALAAFWSLMLYLLWRRSQRAELSESPGGLFTKPGCTFALMFILYGLTRFFIEFIREDNPFEYAWWAIYRGGTAYQNLSIYLIILGTVLMVIFQRHQPKTVDTQQTQFG